MATQPLPDPHWMDVPETCMQCGYSLRGLEAPGRCPECGAEFDRRSLVLAGVAQGQRGGSVARRAAFWIIAASALIMSQTIFLALLFAWWLALVMIAVVVGGLAWFWITGPRERRGAERFIITSTGIARVPLVGNDMKDRLFVPWADADAFALTRISPFWRRIRIGRRTARGKIANVRFDAGIRCPDAMAPDVEAALQSLLQSPAPPQAHPPTEPVQHCASEPRPSGSG